MHLVWKRPDGFHEATPGDYQVVDLGQNFNLWLHKQDKDQYPFRIAGGWEEKEGTVRLNNLVNLLGQPDELWLKQLEFFYDHSMKDDRVKFVQDLQEWVMQLTSCPKGDTWETEIMKQALSKVHHRVSGVEADFIAGSASTEA